MRNVVMMFAVMFTASVFAGASSAELKEQAAADRAEAQELLDAARQWEEDAREKQTDGRAQLNKANSLATRAAFAKGNEKQDLLEEAAELRRSAQANFERAQSLNANASSNRTSANSYSQRAVRAESDAMFVQVREQQIQEEQRQAAKLNEQNQQRRAEREKTTPREDRKVVQRRPVWQRQERRQGHTEATKWYTVNIYRDKIIYDDGTSDMGEEYAK